MSRLVLIDPALRNRTGHHYNFNFALIEQWKDRGLPFVTLGHQGHEEAVGRELAIQPVFRTSHYSGRVVEAKLNLDRKTAQDYLGRLLYEDLVQHAGLIGQPGDVVVFQIGNAAMLLATAFWLKEFHKAWDGPVVLYFMGVDFALGPDLAELYRSCLPLLAALPAARLRLIAEHYEIAQQLEILSEHTLPISEAPHFKSKTQMTRLMELTAHQGPTGAPLRIGYLGHARLERGAHLIPGIVRRTRQLVGDRATFQVHMDLRGWNGMQIHPSIREDLMELTPEGINRLFLGDMSMEAYFNFLSGVDLMLFPYNERYALSGSGIYFEALACGMPMVVPRDSFMHRHLERLGGGVVPFDTLDETAVATAVAAAIDRFPELRAKSSDVGPAWQRDHDLSDFASSLLGRPE